MPERFARESHGRFPSLLATALSRRSLAGKAVSSNAQKPWSPVSIARSWTCGERYFISKNHLAQMLPRQSRLVSNFVREGTRKGLPTVTIRRAGIATGKGVSSSSDCPSDHASRPRERYSVLRSQNAQHGPASACTPQICGQHGGASTGSTHCALQSTVRRRQR